jgi:hypothetical protein
MVRLSFLASVSLMMVIAGCSTDAGDDDTSEGGSGGSTSQPSGGGAGAGGDGKAGSAGGAAGSTSKGGSGGSGTAGSAGAMAGAGAGGRAGAGAGGGGAGGAGSEFSEVGVCGERGEGMVSETEFSGFQELYIIGEEGFGEDVCVVRFDVKRVAAAPDGCDDPAGDVDCLWTHTVELSNPSMVTDEGGACANSDLGLTQAKIAALAGTRASYGFVSEFAGHNSVLMEYDETSKKWDAGANATWDEATGMFRFDSRDGVCNYGKK